MKQNLQLEIAAMLRSRSAPGQAVTLLGELIGQIVASAPAAQKGSLLRLALFAIDKALIPRPPESPTGPSAPSPH